MKNDTGKRSITGLPVLVIFLLFALCIMAVLLTGAEGYRELVRSGEEAHEIRTAGQYLTTKVRQSADFGLGTFGCSDALELREQIDGRGYITRIYCHEGWLYELFSSEEAGLSPEDGEKILPMQSLQFQKDSSLLKITFALPDSPTRQLYLLVRSEEGVP